MRWRKRLFRFLAFTLALFCVLLLVAGAVFFRGDIAPERLEATYLTPESRYLSIAGERLHVRVRGSGQTLFLLHGSFASLHTWSAFEDTLSLYYQTVSLDFPGHGLTGPSPGGHYSLDAYADLVLALADSMQINTFAVAGNSMGGAVACRVALRAPDRVRALILLDAAGAPPPDPLSNRPTERPAIFQLLSRPWVANLLSRFTPRFLFERNLRDVYGNRERIPAGTIDRYYQLMLRAGNRQATLARLRTPNPDRSAELASITCPTLIIWGEKDRWIPVHHARLFRKAIPHAEVSILREVGHVPMEESPRETASVVLKFLQQKPGQNSQQ